MISRKGMLLLLGSIMLLAIGILLMNYQIIVLSILFLIFISLAQSKIPNELEIVRQPSGLRVFEGDEFKMDLQVKTRSKTSKNKINNLGLGTNLVEFTDTLPEHVGLAAESNYKIFQLGGRPRNVSYSIFCPIRRYHTLGPINVRIMDEFRLFQNEVRINSYHQFPVHINYRTTKDFKLQTKAFDWNFGQNLLNLQGKSNAFYSIRDYTKQDSYREINWKASAKERKLMVNVFERETLSDCCIFLDTRYITGYGRPDDNFLEYSVRLAFGLASSIIGSNNRLSVVTYGESIRLLPPSLGRNHNAYIHALLINTEPKGYNTFYTAVGYIWPYLKPKSTIVIFSPIDYDDNLIAGISYLQRLDMKIILVTSAPMTFESRALGKVTLRNKLDLERRRLHILELERWGVEVVSWVPEDNFEIILKKINIASGAKAST